MKKNFQVSKFTIFKNSFQDVVYYRILDVKPCDTKLVALEYKAKFEKNASFIYVRNRCF